MLEVEASQASNRGLLKLHFYESVKEGRLKSPDKSPV